MSRRDYITKHIYTDFGSIAYHFKGPKMADTAIIFLHGHFDSALENRSYHLFDQNDEVLKIFLDHRWHGSSTRTKFYPSLSERAEDIDILIESILISFPSIANLHIAGYSQGGAVLLYYITGDQSQKSKLNSVFIIAPRIRLRDYLKWFSKDIDEMERLGKKDFTKKYRSKGLVKYNGKYLKEFSEINLYDLVSKLKVPSVLIRGTEDDLITKEEATRLINLSNNSMAYHEISDLGHNPDPKHWNKIYKYIKRSIDA
ncbi:MAG: alpha/beta hydrolase [Candidatus Doudnabacteria bacterium]|nr:alpha/beta hydrolase [Candidatus Doudnabacteria bacterium]